jgi:hypothetical protein
MGQRLNIEIIQNDITLANGYYHWSAYTSSSLQLTKKIIESINEFNNKNNVIRAIRLLEKTGALLTIDEIKLVKNIDESEHFEEATSRNEGLISISEEGIKETRLWEEGRVEVNLDKCFINFDVFWKSGKESFISDYEKSEDWYQQLPINKFNFEHIPFSEFNQINDEVTKMINNKNYHLRMEDGNVLSFIE